MIYKEYHQRWFDCAEWLDANVSAQNVPGPLQMPWAMLRLITTRMPGGINRWEVERITGCSTLDVDSLHTIFSVKNLSHTLNIVNDRIYRNPL
jgi:hypothetical protein